MEIISYNIWDLPLWFVRDRRNRLLKIGEYVSQRGTDIICLQESWSLSHRKALSEFMREKGYHDAIFQAGIKRGNGGLLTFSTFPIKSVRFIPFGRWGISVSEFIGNKGALETIVETPKGLLRVLNIHLHHESSKIFNSTRIRLRQLRKLLTLIKDDEEIATVLAGDFNQHDMANKKLFNEIFGSHNFVFHGDIETVQPTYRKENNLVNNWINRIAHSQTYDYILTKHLNKIDAVATSYTPLYIDPVLSDHDPVSLIIK
ncbi:MAG: endonuclease/exonuclease/phosphatase family protein [Candidatus Paceibacterota bacterium]